MTQVTTSAHVTNGVVSIDLRCDASVACEGALVVYTERFERLGGADFHIDASATATVDVGLVDNWQDLLAASNSPNAATFIWLIGPGREALIDSAGSLSLTPAP